MLLFFFCIWLIFGSFSTVLIERWHSGKGGILMGRSECPKCNHILGTRDLVPLFSYIWNRGKCAHCKNPIPLFYPAAELLMGTIFMIVAYAGMRLGMDVMSAEMILLLFFWFVTGVYVLYDLKYMEIPDQIMIPTIYILLLIPFLSLLFIWYSEYSFHIFPIPTIDRLMGAVILYTFFYLQILIPGSIFLIRNKDYKNILRLIGSYFTFPIMMLVDIFRKKKDEDEVEIPTWIGGWDLRVALFIWLTLGTIHAVVSLGIAYIFGSIIWVSILLLNAIKKKKTPSQIPFWPFLGFGWIMAILFYPEIYMFFKII